MANDRQNRYTVNPGGFEHPDDLINKVISLKGILKKILGDAHDDIVYDQEAEFCRRALKEIYQFTDTNDIFPKVLHKSRFFKTLETIFRLYKPESDNASR